MNSFRINSYGQIKCWTMKLWNIIEFNFLSKKSTKRYQHTRNKTLMLICFHHRCKQSNWINFVSKWVKKRINSEKYQFPIEILHFFHWMAVVDNEFIKFPVENLHASNALISDSIQFISAFVFCTIEKKIIFFCENLLCSRITYYKYKWRHLTFNFTNHVQR